MAEQLIEKLKINEVKYSNNLEPTDSLMGIKKNTSLVKYNIPSVKKDLVKLLDIPLAWKERDLKEDLNLLNDEGIYYAVSGSCKNTPSQSNGYILNFIRYTSYRLQIFITATNAIYLRNMQGDTWGLWVKIG